jgi:hypothetical protein
MFLKRREEIIQANNRAMMLVSTNLEELEKVIISHTANVSALINHQQQRVDSLETKCGRLRSLVAIVHLNSLSLASNNLGDGLQGIREEDIIIQIRDPMDIKELDPIISVKEEEEQCSVHT